MRDVHVIIFHSGSEIAPLLHAHLTQTNPETTDCITNKLPRQINKSDKLYQGCWLYPVRIHGGRSLLTDAAIHVKHVYIHHDAWALDAAEIELIWNVTIRSIFPEVGTPCMPCPLITNVAISSSSHFAGCTVNCFHFVCWARCILRTWQSLNFTLKADS